MIEVEIRGRIKNFDKTLNEFRKKTKFIEEKDRFSLVYFRTGCAATREELKNEKIDFKLRITNKKPEIVMKYGIIKGSESRREISIPIKLEDFDEAVDLFKLLGWHSGVIMATKTFVFEYKGIEFAIVKNPDLDYFEAEKIIKDEEKAGKIEQEIKEICKEFNLEIFDEEDFWNALDKINQKKENLFDFTKQDFKEIKERFKEFF